MNIGQWRSWALIIIVFSTVSCGALTFGWFSWPPTVRITKNYFEAIIKRDVTQAMRYTVHSPQGERCARATEKAAHSAITMYGGATVQQIKIDVLNGTGSDETIQFGHVKFLYQLPGQSAWHTGNLQLLTTYDNFGVRYPCGATP